VAEVVPADVDADVDADGTERTIETPCGPVVICVTVCPGTPAANTVFEGDAVAGAGVCPWALFSSSFFTVSAWSHLTSSSSIPDIKEASCSSVRDQE